MNIICSIPLCFQSAPFIVNFRSCYFQSSLTSKASRNTHHLLHTTFYQMRVTRAAAKRAQLAQQDIPSTQVADPQTVPSSNVTQNKSNPKATKRTNKKDKNTVTPPTKKPRNEVSSQVTTSTTDSKAYYLFKSEPESRIQNGHEMKFSIDDLEKESESTTHWDGVRNAESKNCMLAMKQGDLGFFYHSNTRKSRPGIVGIVQVIKEAYPDHTALDKNDPHYDPKSTSENPRWHMVDVKLVEKFSRCVTLDELKAASQLADMQLVKRGRISVQHVKKDEWDFICDLAEKEAPQPQTKAKGRRGTKK